eukprot:424663-Alexandrium_andersonii.AAC.1
MGHRVRQMFGPKFEGHQCAGFHPVSLGTLWRRIYVAEAGVGSTLAGAIKLQSSRGPRGRALNLNPKSQRRQIHRAHFKCNNRANQAGHSWLTVCACCAACVLRLRVATQCKNKCC